MFGVGPQEVVIIVGLVLVIFGPAKAAQAEHAEVVVDGRPRREVARQHPPGAATPQDVEDGVEDVAQGMGTHPHGPGQFG